MTIIPFVPNNNTAPPFYATVILDGSPYGLAAAWNIAGQRWYFTLTDPSGNRIFTGALIGSPSGYDIPLAPGLFSSSTLVYREDTGNFEQTP